MSLKNKTIDFFSLWDENKRVDLRVLFIEHYKKEIKFDKHQGRIKHFIHTLEAFDNYLVGVVATCRQTGVHPVLNGATKAEREQVLDTDEGYGIANAFLYDHRHNILLYEFTQMGLFANFFRDMVAISAPAGANIRIESIARGDVFTDVMNMDIKDIHLVMSMPRELVLQANLEHAPIGRVVGELEIFEPYEFEIKLKTGRSRNRPRGTLNEGPIKQFIRNIQDMIQLDFGHHVQKAIVRGFEVEEEDGTLSNPLDLVTGRLREKMELEEPDVLAHLLVRDRIHGISDIYQQYIAHFDARRR